MFDLVEAQIERGKFGESIEALDMCNKVVVQVEFCDGRGEIRREFGFLDLVLAETESLRGPQISKCA
jgi:hypothetical protein